MTTDITELARERLKEKFDVWFEREYKHLESSKYTDAVPHIKYGFWTAYQAGGAELVEALEKAHQVDEELCKLLPPGAEYMDPPDGGDVTPLEGVRRMVADYRQRIAELESRTVKLPDCDLAAVQHMSGGSKDYCNGFVDGTQNAIRAMRAAGVDVREAE